MATWKRTLGVIVGVISVASCAKDVTAPELNYWLGTWRASALLLDGNDVLRQTGMEFFAIDFREGGECEATQKWATADSVLTAESCSYAINARQREGFIELEGDAAKMRFPTDQLLKIPRGKFVWEFHKER